jgi:hypothetical protein
LESTFRPNQESPLSVKTPDEINRKRGRNKRKKTG